LRKDFLPALKRVQLKETQAYLAKCPYVGSGAPQDAERILEECRSAGLELSAFVRDAIDVRDWEGTGPEFFAAAKGHTKTLEFCLGQRINALTGEASKASFLFQCLRAWSEADFHGHKDAARLLQRYVAKVGPDRRLSESAKVTSAHEPESLEANHLPHYTEWSYVVQTTSDKGQLRITRSLLQFGATQGWLSGIMP
jgi:hypothetical protein